jgi:hypothetical protein
MRRKIYIAASAIIVILAIGFLYVRSTPNYSLNMLTRAIEARNPDQAMKYINIDSIVDNLGRNLLGISEASVGSETRGKSSLKGMVFDALPGIKKSIRSSVRAAIASHGENKRGSGPKKTASNKKINESLNTNSAQDVPERKTTIRLNGKQQFSIGGITIGNLDVRRIEKISLWDLTVENDGKSAGVSVKDTPNIKARMTKTDGGYWEIVEVLFLP